MEIEMCVKGVICVGKKIVKSRLNMLKKKVIANGV